jgi:hypothetical protein
LLGDDPDLRVWTDIVAEACHHNPGSTGIHVFLVEGPINFYVTSKVVEDLVGEFQVYFPSGCDSNLEPEVLQIATTTGGPTRISNGSRVALSLTESTTAMTGDSTSGCCSEKTG